MHRITWLLILTLAATGLFAAKSHMGYIDSERILQESDDAQEAQKLFEAEMDAWEQQISDLETEIEELRTQYQNKRLVLTQAGREEAEAEIADSEAELSQLIQDIYGENGLAATKNSELLQPVMEKLTDAIKTVADENNLEMIFDAAAGGMLYAIPGLDYTDHVIDEMNTASVGGDETGTEE